MSGSEPWEKGWEGAFQEGDDVGRLGKMGQNRVAGGLQRHTCCLLWWWVVSCRRRPRGLGSDLVLFVSCCVDRSRGWGAGLGSQPTLCAHVPLSHLAWWRLPFSFSSAGSVGVGHHTWSPSQPAIGGGLLWACATAHPLESSDPGKREIIPLSPRRFCVLFHRGSPLVFCFEHIDSTCTEMQAEWFGESQAGGLKVRKMRWQLELDP